LPTSRWRALSRSKRFKLRHSVSSPSSRFRLSELSPEQVRLAKRLATDAATAELARAFRAQNLRWILLKGPVTASRLYKDGTFRDYGDIDALVAPEDYAVAVEVIESLGYHRVAELPRDQVEHALAWERPTDHSFIDLHHHVPHTALEAERAWAAFTRDSEEMTIAGERVEVIGMPAFALLMVFHALHNAPERGKPLVDLERAVAQIPLEVWVRARALAAELATERNLAAGLMLTPAASKLRKDLRLPSLGRWERYLRRGTVMRTTLPIRVVSRAKGPRSKLRALRGEVLPSSDTKPFFEKTYSSSMFVAGLRRIGRVLMRIPLALGAWYLERRDRRGGA
jgi:hypothetical protein